MGCGCKLRKSITNKKLDINKRDVYLDYNSTTQPDYRVLNEIDKINRLYWGNPSSQNTRGVNLYNLILKKGQRVLDLLNLQSSYFYFDTSSSSIIKKIKESNIHITSSNIEHSSLLNLSDNSISVTPNGQIDLNELENHLKKNAKTTFIYSPVNHEVGIVQNIKNIFLVCKKYDVTVILDAVQTIHRLKISDWIDFCDGFYFSGHKIHSIPGASMLILKDELKLSNINSTVDFSLYTGTFNSSAVVGLLTAMEILIIEQDEVLNNLKVLQKDGVSIINNGIKGIHFESDPDNSVGIINISIKDLLDVESLLLHLNSDGIYISRFSACNGNINEKSQIIKALGRSSEHSLNSLRISFGKDSKRDDFFRFSKSVSNYLTYYNK